MKQPDGLWVGAPWSDNPTGFVVARDFRVRNKSVESLYGNVVAAGAWRSLANIARVLGKTAEATACETAYSELKSAINKTLYRPEFNNYAYYKSGDKFYDYREDITTAMLDLYGIADQTRTAAYHGAFKATPYGYRNVDPELIDSNENLGKRGE